MNVKAMAAGLVVLALSVGASAAPVTYYDTIAGGQAAFTSTVTGAGGTVNTANLSGLSAGSSWDLGDFTISTTDGGYTSISNASQNNSTGQMIDISPSYANPENSGITFTFDSAINGLGFEVGDWGTCCLPSSLYIAFDGGSDNLVATATNYNDNPTVAAGGGYGDDTVFIGAIDDSATFTTVTFYGDGYGEILTAGGTIYYTNVDIGSVSNVSEPGTFALMGLGLVGLGLTRRKKA